MNTPSLAMQFIAACWKGIPRRSWRNRNGAMHEALTTAISSGMQFEPDDMQTIGQKYNAGYWTSDGEGIYSLACSAQSGANISAAIAIEQWKGRPPYLWAETTKTAERLYVGTRFTWEGERLTVTSLSGTRLVACSYTKDDEVTYIVDGYRCEEARSTSKEGHVMLRYSPILKGHDPVGKIKRRFKISHEELRAKRLAYDAKRRAYVKEMEEATTLEQLEAIQPRFAADGAAAAFRHFDVEIIRDAFKAADGRIMQAMCDTEQRRVQEERRARMDADHDADLARWLAGEKVDRYFEVVRLRVKGEWVETSTQQRATVAGVRSALAFIKKHRRKGWHQNGTSFDLDQYPLQEINDRGVQVGCTFVEWAEIDRIAPLLK